METDGTCRRFTIFTGSVHPCIVLTFSLYDADLPTYLPTNLHESGEGGNGEEEMRTRHISKSLQSNLSIWRRWIGITTDRNGSERIEGTSGWDCEDTTTRAIAKNCRWPCVLLVADIWISTRSARARQLPKGIRSGRVNKNSLDFSRHLGSPGSTQFQSASRRQP